MAGRAEALAADTGEDTATLAHPAAPLHEDLKHAFRHVIDAPEDWKGEEFPVRRAFVRGDLADLDPIIHLDQIREANYCPVKQSA